MKSLRKFVTTSNEIPVYYLSPTDHISPVARLNAELFPKEKKKRLNIIKKVFSKTLSKEVLHEGIVLLDVKNNDSTIHSQYFTVNTPRWIIHILDIRVQIASKTKQNAERKNIALIAQIVHMH